MIDRKPYRHRFSLNVIGYALRLYHRFPLSQRDVQELLHERGIQVSYETLRQFCAASDRRTTPPRTPPGFSVASGRGVREGRWGGALVVAGGR